MIIDRSFIHDQRNKANGMKERNAASTHARTLIAIGRRNHGDGSNRHGLNFSPNFRPNTLLGSLLQFGVMILDLFLFAIVVVTAATTTATTTTTSSSFP
jgi:hypothetical protein